MQEILKEFRGPTPGVCSWFITQTIDPKLNSKPAEYQFAATLNLFIKILEKYCSDYQYVTELTEQANVHYHAWVVFRNVNNKFRFINEIKKTKNLGFCKINKDPIIEYDRVALYMIDIGDDKAGKNLKAAYALIQKREVIGSFCPIMYQKPLHDLQPIDVTTSSLDDGVLILGRTLYRD